MILCTQNLTTNNAELLQKRVGLDMIQTFIGLLKSCGPVVMYVEFLEGLASCSGAPFVWNQEHLLEALYGTAPQQSGGATVDLMALIAEASAAKIRRQNRLCMSVESTVHRPSTDAMADEKMAEIMICWQGSDSWKAGTATAALFYPATSPTMGSMRLEPNVSCPEELQAYRTAVEKTKTPLNWVKLSDLTSPSPANGGRGSVALDEGRVTAAFVNKNQLGKYYQVSTELMLYSTARGFVLRERSEQ
jgi:hypothetical protein